MQIQSLALVVSIHDVVPSTQDIVQKMMDDLKLLGVSFCSLLVVPHYHNKDQESLIRASSFIRWLQEKQKEGHEIVLHGWSHLRPIAASETYWARWMTQCYTRGEGEFYDLGYRQARTKLKKGKEILNKIGFEVEEISGFIAPAWLLSQEGERAVSDEGFSYTTRLHGVINFQKGKEGQEHPAFYRSQSMVYSVSSVWRRRVSLVWNEFLLRRAERQAWPLLRLGLHPPDWNHSAIQKHALTAASRALRKRTAMTYRQWINQMNEPEYF